MSNIGTKFILAKSYIFDPNSNSLTTISNSQDIVRLGSNESRILLMLCEQPNNVITRDELHEFVWRDQGFQVDDSSLTQAISTLRKMLKDSTKSPQYVKTVPKRGYQLICSVETSNPSTQIEEDATQGLDSTARIESDTHEESKNAPVLAPQVASKPNLWESTGKLSRILLLLALLAPVLALLAPKTSPSSFRLVTTINDMPVYTTEAHPDLTSWLPQIEICANFYAEKFNEESDPIAVYATAGQNRQLYLNYVHPEEFSGLNSVVRLIAEQSELNKICK
jgi:cholera toxin transcriptional activator